MVKKWIVMIIIIIVLAVSCVLESNYVNSSFLFLENNLNEYRLKIENTAEENLNNDENIKFISELHDEWHDKLKGLKCLIWHSGVKEVEVGLSRIQTYTKENDKTETLVEIKALMDFLDHYSEDFTIAVENIL